jgi:WhiB family redox-sensing transcriptional regulator
MSPAPKMWAGELEWMAEGACVGDDPDRWFPQTKRETKRDTPQVLACRAICAGCPVRDECREYAIARPEPIGIWGGLTEHELRAIRRERAAA